MGAVTQSYRAASNLTVTNLASIATSTTWVAGWLSGVIDNTTNLDLDIVVSGKITFGNVTTAGELRMYAMAMLDDSTWPDITGATEGTEGTATINASATTIRDATMVLVCAFANRVANGDVFFIPQTSLRGAFGGFLPPKIVLFVTHSTGVNLAASGHQITIKGITESVA